MKIKLTTIILFAVVLVACNSTKNIATPAALAKVQAIVDKDTLRIEVYSAQPQTSSLIGNTGLLPPGDSGSNINLMGNENYFIKTGDSLSIYLPYFGVRQMGGRLDSDKVGIEFKGVPKSTDYNFDSDKNLHVYDFKINKSTETLDVELIIYPSLNADIRIFSSHRTNINFRGKIIE
ncbi:DUF4251 domain-containing protein [Pontimicrobium sp. IMCC45349]|uniref:DUF4251 domain-containing protein n=1 Tax=Pontimicrobium sp. IMCC45349 TaxID=3391574 RepID=UPI0039A29F52